MPWSHEVKTGDCVGEHVLGEPRSPLGDNGWEHRYCVRCGIDFQYAVKKRWESAAGVSRMPFGEMPMVTVPGRKAEVFTDPSKVMTCEEAAVLTVHGL